MRPPFLPYHMSVEMCDVDRESNQRISEGYGKVHVEVVATALKHTVPVESRHMYSNRYLLSMPRVPSNWYTLLHNGYTHKSRPSKCIQYITPQVYNNIPCLALVHSVP